MDKDPANNQNRSSKTRKLITALSMTAVATLGQMADATPLANGEVLPKSSPNGTEVAPGQMAPGGTTSSKNGKVVEYGPSSSQEPPVVEDTGNHIGDPGLIK